MARAEPDQLIGSVADTAFWVAHHRAQESARPDALFNDPLAGVLAGSRGKAIAEAMPRPAFTAWVISVRTVVIDAYIRDAIDAGVDMIVNLGAGLDTRPYRMDLPSSLQWVEVDQQAVIAFKEEKLAGERARCNLSRVALDLGDLPARRKLFADLNSRATKMLVLTEGVVPYLSNSDVAALANDLRGLNTLQGWIVDYISAVAIKARGARMQRQMQNAPFKFMPDDWQGFFADHGWRVSEMRYLADEAKKLNRRFPMPLWAVLLWVVRAAFAPKAKRAEYARTAGYALLVPR